MHGTAVALPCAAARAQARGAAAALTSGEQARGVVNEGDSEQRRCSRQRRRNFIFIAIFSATLPMLQKFLTQQHLCCKKSEAGKKILQH